MRTGKPVASLITKIGDYIARAVVREINKNLEFSRKMLAEKKQRQSLDWEKHVRKIISKIKNTPKKKRKAAKKCSIRGCPNLARAKGLCTKCYQKIRYHQQHRNAKKRTD